MENTVVITMERLEELLSIETRVKVLKYCTRKDTYISRNDMLNILGIGEENE